MKKSIFLSGYLVALLFSSDFSFWPCWASNWMPFLLFHTGSTSLVCNVNFVLHVLFPKYFDDINNYLLKKKKKNNLWKCATLTLLATIVTISISPIYAYIYKKKRQFSKRNGVKVGRFFLVKSAPRTECKQSSRRGRPKLWTWIFTCANFLTPRRASHSNSQTQDGNKNYMNTFNLRLSLATIARMIILKKKKKT